VTTNFRGKNTSDHHSFEVWFDEGKVKFFMHAATEAAADKFRRRVGNNYANSEVFPRRRWSCLPVIDPDEYVAGAWLEMELPYYPIRHHNSDEWATDPYGEITSEMLSLDDSTVVTQVVFRPAKQSWTDGDRFKHNSVDDLAHALRQGTSVGWLDPQTRPASQKDKSRPPKPSNSSVASKRSTSTSASSQPPRTRTKPKRVPVGSPGCSESTTTP